MLSGDCNVCINGKMPSYSATCVECGLSRKNFKPMTNADRIRAMTDEELAEWFNRIQYDVSDYYCGGHSCEPTLPTGKESWLGWLKQEASDGKD